MFRQLAAVFLFSLISVSVAHAKDLSNRLGIGYTAQFSEPLPSVAARYYPRPHLGFSGALGIDTREGNSRFGFMGKVYRIIFEETNLNFYMGAGVGLLSLETAGENDSGFELNGFAGCEFFFEGLENLGFSFEVGIGITSISDGVRFRTIGEFPTKAGVIFYF